VADRVGSTRARGSIYWNAGLAAHGRGRMDDAVRLTDRAIALIGEQEDGRDLPRLRMHYAWLLLEHPQPRAEEALEQLDRAERYPAVVGSQLDLGTVATFRGRALLLLGRVDEAAENAARALQLLGVSDHVNRATALLLLADVGLARFDAELTRDALSGAREVLAGMKDSRVLAHLWRDLGDGFKRLGDNESAVTAYDRSLEMIGLTARPVAPRVSYAHAG
jgi:tetratricopeptide (TPR) repeat protein